MRKNYVLIGAVILTVLPGCFDANIFPVWDPNYFDDPPAPVGPFQVEEFRVDVPDGADGSPTGITVFRPLGTDGPLPVFLWVMGSNVQAYYHQSLHETLASWGYAVVISDGRPLTFTDFQYHRRTVDLARQAIQLAVDGELDVEVDESRIAAGGYSIGATMAAFVAAEDPRVAALVFWAPTGSPFWTGVDPDELLAQVTSPSLFLLGELDPIAPATGWPAEMQNLMADSTATVFVIEQGTHLFFQQPTGADSAADPVTELTRFEQQGIAIEETRDYLNVTLGVAEP
jgi:dienelactone hydrolase